LIFAEIGTVQERRRVGKVGGIPHQTLISREVLSHSFRPPPSSALLSGENWKKFFEVQEKVTKLFNTRPLDDAKQYSPLETERECEPRLFSPGFWNLTWSFSIATGAFLSRPM